ncbi:tRNA uridine-5-carboxymethylaminomethyl(34) synthesis enzyme MnmG [Lentisphaerota bacterium WC36G]|nr:tRNA uridine-5-carboxymethylaminomethyl(34) synthesis enzyme MnmG [Lentisphaerae bacterium WC36]
MNINKNFNEYNYNVIVIGGGHAGCDAAMAAARLGAKTLLITINMDHIAQMSCNPAIGGIAKGQVVREIDALGGVQGRVTDAAAIQFRMLNSAKGPAVWSPRAQCDRHHFQRAMKYELERQENLDIKQAFATKFIMDKANENIVGIETNFADYFYCDAMVICSGTFLNGLLHYGMQNFTGGRAGDPASIDLANNLKSQLDLRIGRLKTGTPPRILAKTIDFSKMEYQASDNFEEQFSHFTTENVFPKAEHKEMPCYMVYSNDKTAEVVKENIQKAPMYSGKIEGIGARYCPSFEDKVIRFPHHEKHLLYLEPEGEFTEEYYINGISTSLPPEVQNQMIQSVEGLENAVISRYAYAIEYDFIFPDQLERTLMTKRYNNLFTAGQINGTSGYEEAAGQGLVAGMNAAKVAAGKTPVELSRDTSYIGVMIDDLVTKEIIEPYRLFTSRAEYRLRLRQDNTDLRLCEFAHQNGLLDSEKYLQFVEYKGKLENSIYIAKSQKVKGKTYWEHLRLLKGKFDIENEQPIEELPFDVNELELDFVNSFSDRRAMKQLAIEAHYEGYIRRENQSVNRLNKLEKWRIPKNFDYNEIKGLRNESRMKLCKVNPTSLAQATRIDGVTPAEIALLQVHLKRLQNKTENNS